MFQNNGYRSELLNPNARIDIPEIKSEGRLARIQFANRNLWKGCCTRLEFANDFGVKILKRFFRKLLLIFTNKLAEALDQFTRFISKLALRVQT
jgi:hypothetical protein